MSYHVVSRVPEGGRYKRHKVQLTLKSEVGGRGVRILLFGEGLLISSGFVLAWGM